MIRAIVALSALLAAAMPAAADDAGLCQSLETTPRQKIEVCTRVIKAGTVGTYTLAMVYFSRSVAYEALGDMEHAMADLDAAIRVRPNELFYAQRGHWHEERGEFAAALADYTDAMRVSSMPYLALGRRIHVYRAMGDFEHALADCNELIEHTPKSAAHRVLRGDVYRQMGDLDRAIADYREALRLDPNHRLATRRLAEAERERT